MQDISPYESWAESKVDARGDLTQIHSLTIDTLSQYDYALTNNRVNRGPYENNRRAVADQLLQEPHYMGNTDRYGWADWVRTRTATTSNLAPDLKEHGETPAPGAELNSTYFKRKGTAPGCNSCRRNRYI